MLRHICRYERFHKSHWHLSIWTSRSRQQRSVWTSSSGQHQSIWTSSSGQQRSLWTSSSEQQQDEYDVIVVGGGHAGTEAACAAARMGAHTLLLTHKLHTIGEMSCNPSFGGIGKGHLLKEVDALDGVCAKICDLSGIHYKTLNKRRGPAVWGPRAQIDRALYKQHIQQFVSQQEKLTVRGAPVEDLILTSAQQPDSHLTHSQCAGVVLDTGEHVYGRCVVLTTGTFLRGSINIGLEVRAAGRLGDAPSIGLADTLDHAGFSLARLKTGTPPRIDARSVDFSKTERHVADDPPLPFSFMNDSVWIKAEDQLPCHLTRTTAAIDPIVRDNLHLNRHVMEETNGPRYCPSIESKVLRFGKKTHQVWLEPEGLSGELIYPSGLSCTLPPHLQQQLVNCIPGLEHAHVTQPGYGVEYDFIDPRQIKSSLETYKIQRLFFAGQINGTTGYEEAAAQGVVAGVNAVCRARELPPFTLSRTESYIGVLIDDLTTQGTSEPYRMFTSRAEFRIHLRPDNADIRLTHKGFAHGCVSEERHMRTRNITRQLAETEAALKDMKMTVAQWKQQLGLPASSRSSQAVESGYHMITFPAVNAADVIRCLPPTMHQLLEAPPQLLEKLVVEARYSHCLQKQQEEMEEVQREEQLILPDDLDYYNVVSISEEAKDRLSQARPQTIAAASRVQGVTPAAIVSLLKHVKRSSSSLSHAL